MALRRKNSTNSFKKLTFTADQMKYLVETPLVELEKAKKNKDWRIQITESPTGSGKSTLTTQEFLPRYLEANQDVELIFIVCFDKAVVTALYNDVKTSIKNNYHGKRRVDVMNKKLFEIKIDYEEDSESIDIVVVSTSKFANIYKEYDHNTSKILVPDLLIIDEVHREMACADIDDTLFDFGNPYSNFEPKRLGVVQNLIDLGMLVYGLTGTPSMSQIGESINGHNHFKLISRMPKSELYNRTTYCPTPTSGSLKKTLETAIVCYHNLYDSVTADISTISDEAWKEIEKVGITKIAPRMIIKTSPKHAKEGNGMTFDDAIEEVRPYATTQQADFIVYSSDYKEYSYLDSHGVYKTIHDKNLSEMIDMANDRTPLLRPTYLIVLNAGNVGINMTGLSVVAYLSKPSQDQVYRTQIQLMARTNRMPFTARDHESQAISMASILCSHSERFALTEYVSKMVVSAVFIPDGSQNLKAAIDRYCENTLSHTEGRDFYHRQVFADPANLANLTPMLKQKWVFDQGDINKIARKDYCQACKDSGKTGFCFDPDRLYNTLVANGISVSRIEFDQVNLFQVDHANGNRMDNGANQITVCPIFHQAKTALAGDWSNRYDRETGEKIT